MIVQVDRPFKVAGNDPEYMPGEVIRLPVEHASLFVGLGLAHPTQDTGNVRPFVDDMQRLRHDMGIRPYDPNVYFHDKSSLWDIQPGQKILIIRKYGGLGDILICSYLLQAIHERFPDNPLTFANPRRYRDLFEGVDWLHFLEYDDIFKDYNFIRGGVIANEVTEQYDVVEDVSTPCHIWEATFKNFDFDRAGLLWRNRLDVWGNWVGVYGFDKPTSCINIHPGEVKRARGKFFGNAANPLLLAPMSALDAKDYPFYDELRSRLVQLGWNVFLAGNKKYFMEREPVPPLYAQNNRELLAMVGAADHVVTVDSAFLHATGIMGTPGAGIFNINDGATYCKYYPNITPVQLCDRPCIMLYCHQCQYDYQMRKTCYPKDSVDRILAAVPDPAHPVKLPRRRRGR